MREIAAFELLGLPPTANKALRYHWAKQSRESKMWKKWVFEQCVLTRCAGLHMQKAQLTLTRYSEKEPDFDGLVGSFKWIIDGLKLAGVIEDDKPSVIGSPTYIWGFAPRREGKIHVKIDDPLDLDMSDLKENQLSRHRRVI